MINRLQEQEGRLLDQALFDGLTKLPNRTHFADQVALGLADVPESGPVSVLFIDLDDFKTVNDTMGHAAGDALLGRSRTVSAAPCVPVTWLPALVGTGSPFCCAAVRSGKRDRARDGFSTPSPFRSRFSRPIG